MSKIAFSQTFIVCKLKVMTTHSKYIWLNRRIQLYDKPFKLTKHSVLFIIDILLYYSFGVGLLFPS